MAGFGGGEFTKQGFSIDRQGRLTLQMRIIQTLKDRKNLTFTRDVRLRKPGILELQRVCKFSIPTEGMPKRTWGTRRECKAYMERQL